VLRLPPSQASPKGAMKARLQARAALLLVATSFGVHVDASCSDHTSCSYCNVDTFGCGVGWLFTCYCQWDGSYCSDADTSDDASYEHVCVASGENPWGDDVSGTSECQQTLRGDHN
jgi:hypothetical protein